MPKGGFDPPPLARRNRQEWMQGHNLVTILFLRDSGLKDIVLAFPTGPQGDAVFHLCRPGSNVKSPEFWGNFAANCPVCGAIEGKAVH
jgi:hypothetical protein